MKSLRFNPLAGALLLAFSGAVQAAGLPTLQEVTVTSGSSDLIGVADSASEGTITVRCCVRPK